MTELIVVLFTRNHCSRLPRPD